MKLAEFRAWFSQCVSSFMQMAHITTVDLSNEPTDTLDDDSQCVRLEGFGDITIPPKGQVCAQFQHGGGAYAMPLGSARVRPKGGKPGTRGLYCSQPGTAIYLRGAEEGDKGQIEITGQGGASIVVGDRGKVTVTGPRGAKVVLDEVGRVTIDAAPGQDVVVNGGSAKVARAGDAVQIDAKDSLGFPIVVSSAIIISGADHFKG